MGEGAGGNAICATDGISRARITHDPRDQQSTLLGRDVLKSAATGLAALKRHHSLRLTVIVKFKPKGSKKVITGTELVTVTYVKRHKKK